MFESYGRKLLGQTILIVGGAGNMGRSIARLAAQAGLRPILVGRTEASLAQAVREIDSSGGIPYYVADAVDCRQMRTVFERVGQVNHIVTPTSSGTPHVKPPNATISLVNLPTAQSVYTRLWAAYNVLHLAPHFMPTNGSITIVSGASARRPQPGFGIYGALHGALEALARAAAIELAPVRVNTVSPGCLGVPPMKQLNRHFGQYDDIGVAVLGIIANPAITAATLDVDGGESLGTWSGEPDDDV